MITIRMALLNIGIDNRFDHGLRFSGFLTDRTPDFTVSVSEEELAAERARGAGSDEYLEFTCIYRKIAERLPDYDAFVFHGAVIARGEGTYLFTAPSGTGKTTHIQLWRSVFPDCWVLSGDKPIIRVINGQYYVCGTPWFGKELMGGRSARPLSGICLLHRGEENRIAPASREETARFVMRQVYLPKDPARLQKQLALMNGCFNAVPMFSMYCNTEPAAAQMAWEAMSAAAALQLGQ